VDRYSFDVGRSHPFPPAALSRRPRSVQEPQTRLAPPPCQTLPGQYSGTGQAHPGSSVPSPVSMPTKTFRHVNRRLACARLPGPHLIPQPDASSSSLTTTVFNQRSMRRSDAYPRRATPKGHNLHHLHITASRRTTYPTHPPLRARGARQTGHSGRNASPSAAPKSNAVCRVALASSGGDVRLPMAQTQVTHLLPETASGAGEFSSAGLPGLPGLPVRRR
jgi:hypothetical protein